MKREKNSIINSKTPINFERNIWTCNLISIHSFVYHPFLRQHIALVVVLVTNINIYIQIYFYGLNLLRGRLAFVRKRYDVSQTSRGRYGTNLWLMNISRWYICAHILFMLHKPKYCRIKKKQNLSKCFELNRIEIWLLTCQKVRAEWMTFDNWVKSIQNWGKIRTSILEHRDVDIVSQVYISLGFLY